MARKIINPQVWLVYAAPADKPITGDTMRLAMICATEEIALQIVEQKQKMADSGKTNARFFYQDDTLYREVPAFYSVESFS